MTLRVFALLLWLFFFIQVKRGRAAFDCANIICDPCLDEAIPVDVIFIVDGSATMVKRTEKKKKF